MSALTLTSIQPVSHWRGPLLAVVTLIVGIVLAYWKTAAGMVDIWSRSQTFTHAFLVPPIVVWLVWLKRADLAALVPKPSYSALVPMALIALMWWLGELVAVNSAVQFALTAMVVLAVPLVLGWQVAWTICFPLAFLFFSVPVGEFLEPTLMHWTVEALVAGLRLTGVPVHQEGQQLVIPTGRWEVVAACSGIRYLMATLMAGSLFAYLNFTSSRKRLVFALVSLAVPVVANWLRAYMIVMLGHVSNNQIATGVDHLVYGWVFFGVVIMALFYVGARFADDLPEVQVVDPANVAGAKPARAWPWAQVVVIAAICAAWPLLLMRVYDAPAATKPVHLALPANLGAWTGAEAVGLPWRPHFEGSASRDVRVYRSEPGQVVVDAAYFRGQSSDAKLVSSIHRWFAPGPHGWNVLERGPVAVASAAGVSTSLRSAVLLPPDSGSLGAPAAGRPRIVAWRVYWVGGRMAHNDVHAKLLQAWMAVRGQPDDGVALHVWTIAADEDAATRLLSGFVSENLAMLQQSFARAAGTH